jgi:hypothetical protein
MPQEPTNENLEKLLQEVDRLIKGLAVDLSTAKLLTENDRLGDLVVLSLLDDDRVKSDLWAHLKIISDWLKRTEELYAGQFPDGCQQRDGRYDLTAKPHGFKSRFEIFKEQVEAWESNPLWSAEIILNDPLAVIKRRKRTKEQE